LQSNRKQPNFGAKKQIRANRAEYQGNEEQNAKQSTQGQVSSIGASTAGAEAGMFIEVMICGVKADFLVDTGATLSLASRRLTNQMAEALQPKLRAHSQKVMDAGGNYLHTSGKGVFSIDLGNFSFELSAVVAEIHVGLDGILGLDFLEDHECTVDVAKRTLCIKRKKISASLRRILRLF
jgi:predicted aspartyl protease